MVDKLLYANETAARTSFIIKAQNVLLIDGLFQESGLIENIAQTAAAHAGYKAQLEGQPVKPGFIGAVKDFNVLNLPAAGDTLETEVIVENQILDMAIVTGKIWCKDVLIAGCEMRIFIPGGTA